MADRVTPADVRRMAALARIGIPDDRVDALVAQLSTILEHMAVLREVNTEGAVPATGPGAGGTPMREDAGTPVPLSRPLESFAPRVHHGFLLVPRLATHEAQGSDTAEDG